jgi:hypothetical protein
MLFAQHVGQQAGRGGLSNATFLIADRNNVRQIASSLLSIFFHKNRKKYLLFSVFVFLLISIYHRMKNIKNVDVTLFEEIKSTNLPFGWKICIFKYENWKQYESYTKNLHAGAIIV